MRTRVVLAMSIPLLTLTSGVARDAPRAAPVRASVPHAPRAEPSADERPPLPVAGIGVVLPAQATDVGAPYAGRVRRMPVRLGDRVAQGEVVAHLATDLTRLDLRMARAAVAASQAELREARLTEERLQARLVRTEQLAAEELVTREELAELRFELAASRVRREQVQAWLSEKQARAAQLGAVDAQAEIRAPFSGTIAARYVDVGGTVSAGQPLLRLIDDGALRLRFAVPEKDAARVELGALVIAEDKAAQRLAPLRGIVDRIAPEVDAASRSLFVEARISSPEVARSFLGAMVMIELAPRAGSGESAAARRGTQGAP